MLWGILFLFFTEPIFKYLTLLLKLDHILKLQEQILL